MAIDVEIVTVCEIGEGCDIKIMHLLYRPTDYYLYVKGFDSPRVCELKEAYSMLHTIQAAGYIVPAEVIKLFAQKIVTAQFNFE